jgi:hypothetical protein
MILDRRCRTLSELDAALTTNGHESPRATLASVVQPPPDLVIGSMSRLFSVIRVIRPKNPASTLR